MCGGGLGVSEFDRIRMEIKCAKERLEKVEEGVQKILDHVTADEKDKEPGEVDGFPEDIGGLRLAGFLGPPVEGKPPTYAFYVKA